MSCRGGCPNAAPGQSVEVDCSLVGASHYPVFVNVSVRTSPPFPPVAGTHDRNMDTLPAGWTYFRPSLSDSYHALFTARPNLHAGGNHLSLPSLLNSSWHSSQSTVMSPGCSSP